jgi:hypothetical protein
MVVEVMYKEGVAIHRDACVSMMCEAASKDDVEFLQLLVHCGESLYLKSTPCHDFSASSPTFSFE